MDKWANIEIINNKEEEKNNFQEKHDSCGSTNFSLTKEQLFQLLDGKTVAMYDGEYCNYLSLKKEGEQ